MNFYCYAVAQEKTKNVPDRSKILFHRLSLKPTRAWACVVRFISIIILLWFANQISYSLITAHDNILIPYALDLPQYNL